MFSYRKRQSFFRRVYVTEARLVGDYNGVMRDRWFLNFCMSWLRFILKTIIFLFSMGERILLLLLLSLRLVLLFLLKFCVLSFDFLLFHMGKRLFFIKFFL